MYRFLAKCCHVALLSVLIACNPKSQNCIQIFHLSSLPEYVPYITTIYGTSKPETLSLYSYRILDSFPDANPQPVKYNTFIRIRGPALVGKDRDDPGLAEHLKLRNSCLPSVMPFTDLSCKG